jgi:DNA-binding CsgD family transcriptional regulator
MGTEIDTAGSEDAAPGVRAVEEWLTAAMSGDSADAAARNLILSAAERVCTKKQRAALVHLLDGKSTVEIGRALGVSQQQAYRHLYGDRRDGGGAVKKLREALKQEATLVREVLNEVERDDEGSLKEDVLAWFSGITPLRVDMFGPLATLLVMHLAADAKRTVPVGDLYLYMPRPIVTAALPRLKATGHIATDGITVTIRKTPLDELRKEKV